MKLISILLCTISMVYGETVSISSSCNTKEKDGLYYIKPTVDGEIIPVICNNGYTMIDVSLNYESYKDYFTTLYQYGDDSKPMFGTDCSDSAGWRDWFIPANKLTKWRVARGCSECKPGGIYGDNTAYYMTNGYFCPVYADGDGCTDANYKPEMIENPMCNICDDKKGMCGDGKGRDGFTITDPQSYETWCDCYTLQLTADHRLVDYHVDYCQEELNWRPNFVLDRSQCTCYKPDESENLEFEVDSEDLPLVSTEFLGHLGVTHIDELIEWDDSDSDETSRHVCMAKETVHLTQQDFLYGTYRITECGHYTLDEDVILNFNGPSETFSYENGDSPNAYARENLPWFPTTEQQNSGQYFGFDAFWGPFTLGFFAGISIESAHVWIDLDGHSIGMAPEYYLQQRFFAIIELGNKQFEARQGPVDFGRDDLRIKDIAIKNGILGLTSHHGIHGAFASDVRIQALNIQNFDVGGIQCNGCFRMNIEDCDIGPQNMNIPVLGRYVHGRSVLGRLRYMVDEYGDEEIQFANRKAPTTVKQVADKLVEQMDMIFYHVTQGIEFPEDDPQWMEAKAAFLNPTGWLDGGSAYGILLNGEGTAVVNIGRRIHNTYDVVIRNVEIHDLRVMPRENFWAEVNDGTGAAIVHGFFFETIDWNYGDVYDEETGFYKGDAYTDVIFTANEMFKTDFCPLGSLFFLDGLKDWVFTDGVDLFNRAEGTLFEFECGSDIQSHSAKGAIGIRVDGTQDFTFDTIHIRNLHNWGDLGSDACGEYEEIQFEVGVDVDKDIQYGYTGDNVHGILFNYASGTVKDVTIENLNSWHGSSIGVFVAKGSDIEFDGYASFNNIVAGQKLTKKQSQALILPNAKPFVCSIFVGPNSDHDTAPDLTPTASISTLFGAMVTSKMYGYDYCKADMRVGNMNEPLSPETYGTDVDEYVLSQLNLDLFREGNGDIMGFNHYQFQMILIALSIYIFIGVWGVYKLACDREKNKNKDVPFDEAKISLLSSKKYGSM